MEEAGFSVGSTEAMNVEGLAGVVLAIAIGLLVMTLALYIGTAIFLTKFNKLVNGKGTAMAWFPIFNVYLLGKLAFNKIVGWILVAGTLLQGTYTTTLNGVESSYTPLPANISSIFSIIYSVALFVIFIYAIIKYNKLKKYA